jgi:glyoxylase-like metal-dependent hydrolase (beta-lactamase superfamily II)
VTPVPIHAFNPGPITGAGNWTWLIPGRIPTLIDAGAGDPRHIEALVSALAGGPSATSTPLAQVLVTHGHTDHAGGALAVAGQFPGVRFRKMPWLERDLKWGVTWEPLADGDIIQAGDTTLAAIHTPGHAPDHLCFWHGESRTLFGGDLAIAGTTVWIPISLQGMCSKPRKPQRKPKPSASLLSGSKLNELSFRLSRSIASRSSSYCVSPDG